jgi:8-oxo-dGTP diphosphatase
MNKQKKYCYAYPRPAVTTDCVIFGFDGGGLKLLLTERQKEPFKNMWSLPGGFLSMNETAEECAKRTLLEKTGIKNVFIEQLYTFTDIERDPRERIISVSYFALVDTKQFHIIAGRNTVQAEWFGIAKLPKLAFDHKVIVNTALQRLKGKVTYQPIGFELLQEKFTLTQLQRIYEAILEKNIDKRNFRKKILATGLLKPLNEKERNVARKAAQLFSFDFKTYKDLSKKGIFFEI